MINKHINTVYKQILNRVVVLKYMQIIIESCNKYKGIILPLLLFIFNILLLSNILESDYYFDDTIYMQTPGVVPFTYSTVFDYVSHNHNKWISSGRFYPLVFYAPYIFWILDTVMLYKSFLILISTSAIFLFGYFIYQITKNKEYSYMLILIMPILFQYRIYHDPLLSYYGLMQFLFIFTISSLLFLNIYLDSNKRRYLFISVLFYLFTLLMYEISYIFVILHIALIWYKKKKSRLRLISTYLLTLLIIVCISLYVRYNASSIGHAYTLEINIQEIALTIWHQISSAFPMTYTYFLYGKHSFLESLKHIEMYDIFIGVLFILLYIIISKNYTNKNGTKKILFLFSIFLIVLPAIIISFSPKYQHEIHFGKGYLPVFIQYFGVGLFTMMIYNYSRKKMKYLLLGVLLAILFIHAGTNNSVIKKFNESSKYNRELLAGFFKNNIFKEIECNSKIMFEKNLHSSYHTEKFIRMHSKKHFKILKYDLKKTVQNIYLIDYKIKKYNNTHYAIVKMSLLSNNNKVFCKIYKYTDGWKEISMDIIPKSLLDSFLEC